MVQKRSVRVRSDPRTFGAGPSVTDTDGGPTVEVVDRVVEYSEASLAFDTTDGTSVAITFPRDRREQVSD